jgi:LysM repeat protein
MNQVFDITALRKRAQRSLAALRPLERSTTEAAASLQQAGAYKTSVSAERAALRADLVNIDSVKNAYLDANLPDVLRFAELLADVRRQIVVVQAAANQHVRGMDSALTGVAHAVAQMDDAQAASFIAATSVSAAAMATTSNGSISAPRVEGSAPSTASGGAPRANGSAPSTASPRAATLASAPTASDPLVASASPTSAPTAPAVAPAVSYTVRTGDSWWRIAEQHLTSGGQKPAASAVFAYLKVLQGANPDLASGPLQPGKSSIVFP